MVKRAEVMAVSVHVRKIQKNERAGSFIVLFPPDILRKWRVGKGDTLIIEDRETFAIIRPSGGGEGGGS